MKKQSGGSYAQNWPRTDFGGSVIIKHEDIVEAYVKELGSPGVLDVNVSQKLDEAFQKAEPTDNLTQPATNSISEVSQLPTGDSMPKSSGDELRGYKANTITTTQARISLDVDTSLKARADTSANLNLSPAQTPE